MKQLIQIASLFLMTIGLMSCKGEFEKIRSSGDVELMYKKAYEYYEAEDYLKAQALFELIIGNYRGKKELEDIYFKYAYTYYNLEKYILASYYFNNFTNTFPNSEFRQDADFMSAYSNYQLSPTFRLDQKYTRAAIEELQLFANTYPNSERVAQCNTLIDEMRKKLEKKAFESAMLYYDLRQYQAAIQSFDNLLKDYPDSRNAQETNYYMIRSAYLLAENSVVSKEKERYEDVVKRASAFIRRFQKSEYWNDVNLILKKSQNKLEDARYKNTGARTRP